MYIETIFIEVQEGGFSNRAKLEGTIMSFKKGKRLTITIADKSHRTTRQNNLLWLYSTIIAKELGYTPQEIHEILKFKFLKREKVIEQTREVVNYIESTTKLSKEEFGELIDKIILWVGTDFGISLPLPSTQMSAF